MPRQSRLIWRSSASSASTTAISPGRRRSPRSTRATSARRGRTRPPRPRGALTETGMNGIVCGAWPADNWMGLAGRRTTCYTGVPHTEVWTDARSPPDARTRAQARRPPARAHALALGLDPVALSRRGAPLHGRDERVGDHVQELRRFEHGHRALHELALPAVGDQAVLVAGRGPGGDAPALDVAHAARDRRRAR